MSESLILTRTKPTAVDDADPTLGVFTPPEAEVFLIRDPRAIGFRFSLVFSAAGFTATATPMLRDDLTRTWHSTTPQALVPNRRMVIIPDAGSFDAWIRLTAITGGAPIQVRMDMVFGAD